ncbi:hypothetical protein [uncultured Flavonifractor sp.]|uniref:hypothetical protein n=1 Tax=uncultured Flavonifractor sp. TaxID=1193534 RepID=UPI00263017CD|nr:hypothetical protein [uncultured Flavonifractor sp.]
MTRRHSLILLCAALAGALAALAQSGSDPQIWTGLLAAPGLGLRELSLSGLWGNLGAWAITLVITLLPLLLLALPKGRRPLVWEDWLLLPACGVGLCMVFFSVNPTFLPVPLPEMWPFISLCVYLSLLAAWLVLQMLRRLEGEETDRLAGVLRILLWACALVAAFGTAYSRIGGFASQAIQASLNNPSGYELIFESNSVNDAITAGLILQFILMLLPLVADLFTAFVLAQAASLTAVLKAGLFSQEAVERCTLTATWCRQLVVWSALLTALKNLFQLAFLAFPLQSDFQVYLPLSSLVLATALYLLCRCLQQGKELQEDNQSII